MASFLPACVSTSGCLLYTHLYHSESKTVRDGLYHACLWAYVPGHYMGGRHQGRRLTMSVQSLHEEDGDASAAAGAH